MSVSMWSFVSIPIIAALIGYITNVIAVRMIFRPRQAVKILGVTFHGLVPRRHKEIAQKIAHLIDRDLISHRDVQAVLKDPSVATAAAAAIDEQFDDFVKRLVEKNPVVGIFLQGEIIAEIREVMGQQMTAVFPSIMERVSGKVEENLDFREIVRAKIEAFDLGKLEDIIYEISSRELKTIEILGGVLGFAVGLIQVAIVMVTTP